MKQIKRPFAERIRNERVRLKLPQARLAEVGQVSKTTQVAYEADLHVPNLEYLTLLESLGVDPVFILTGRREKDFDWELLGNICEAIYEWADEHNCKIPPRKFHELERLLYELFVDQRVVDFDVVARHLRLVA